MQQRSLLPESWSVPDIFRARLSEEAGRQRCMVHDGHLLLVLHAFPDSEDSERVGRFFWREPDGTWHGPGADERGPQGLHRHVKNFDEGVERIERREEAATSASEYFEVLRDAVPARRSSRHLHQTLQAAREAVPADRDVLACRDSAVATERGAELVATEAKNGLDYAMAKTAEQQARNGLEMALASHRLNRLVATFFPIATVGAMFGVNMRSGLEELYEPYLFWAMFGATIVIGMILNEVLMSRTKRKRARTSHCA